MRKRVHWLYSRSGSQLLMIVGAFLVLAIALFSDGNTSFVSAEVKFADASKSGLHIMPASCDSVPHWQDECSMPPSCVISVTPNSYDAGTPPSYVTVQWAAPQPSFANDSAVAYMNNTITGIGGVFASGTLNVAAPTASMTYTFNGAYLDVNGTVLDQFTCSAPVTVNYVSGPPPTYTLYINQVELYRNTNDPVYPGDRITYRMYVSNTGTQNWVNIRDQIPTGTTLIWQGGGTYCDSLGDNCNSQSSAGYTGELWWQQQLAPSGTQLYVDFTVEVNANATNGSSICNTGRVYSGEISVANAVTSNEICNTVAVCTNPTDLAIENTQGYKVNPYQASGKKIDQNTVPICVSNTSGNMYFVPAKTSNEIEQFKANLPTGASYQNI